MRSCAVAFTLLAGLALPAAAQDAPDYERFREGVFLRYLNAQESALATEPNLLNAVPRIGLSFGGEPIRAELDSGSTGIVVAARYIPNFDQLQSVGPGKLTYTSSGRVMLGQWVVTPLALVGKEGARVETEPMPVLAVTQVQCLETARECTPTDDPRNIAMVGIGFGREGDAQSQSTPDKNPLLRVTGGNGERRRGYILTREGVHIGLTRENAKGEFRFIKLTKQPDRPDWAGAPACISINGITPPACGTMLVDTGVAAMFMTLPQAQAGDAQRTLPPGTEVAIRAGEGADAFDLYKFTMGGDSALAPTDIHLRVAPDRVFVNTSFHVLNGFDVLFDADGGYAGFRRR